MLAALSQTGNISASARSASIARRSHYSWMESDPDYACAVREAMEVAADVLEAVARKRAVHGSDTLLIFLLKSVRPEKFRDRVVISPAVASLPGPEPSREELQRQLDDRLDSLPLPIARLMHRALEARLRRAGELIEGECVHRQES